MDLLLKGLCSALLIMALTPRQHTTSNATSLQLHGFTHTCNDVILIEGCFCTQGHGGHKEVNCHDLGLTELRVFTVFSSGGMTDFESVHISGNNITRIDDRAFQGVRARKMYLTNNQIRRISDEAFAHSAGVLVHLDLSHNELSVVPAAITHLTELKTVQLTDNDIHVVDWAVFQYLGDNAGSLYLDQNPIESYTNDRDSNYQLKKLVIDLNNFENDVGLMIDPFNAVPEFVCNSLEFFLLTGTHLTGFRLEKSKFPNIKYFGIENGLLMSQILYRRSFRSLRYQLRGLSLSDNLLRDFPSESLSNMIALERLDLSENLISEITNVPNLPNLKFIDVSKNQLDTIGDVAFGRTYLPSLQSVDISDNKLTTLSSDAIPVAELYRFYIKGNPWSCSCDMKWLIELIQRDAEEGEGPFSTTEIYGGDDGARCFEGPLLNDFRLQNLVCFQ